MYDLGAASSISGIPLLKNLSPKNLLEHSLEDNTIGSMLAAKGTKRKKGAFSRINKREEKEIIIVLYNRRRVERIDKREEKK